jgi:hypothetical protein
MATMYGSPKQKRPLGTRRLYEQRTELFEQQAAGSLNTSISILQTALRFCTPLRSVYLSKHIRSISQNQLRHPIDARHLFKSRTPEVTSSNILVSTAHSNSYNVDSLRKPLITKK